MNINEDNLLFDFEKVHSSEFVKKHCVEKLLFAVPISLSKTIAY